MMFNGHVRMSVGKKYGWYDNHKRYTEFTRHPSILRDHGHVGKLFLVQNTELLSLLWGMFHQ